MKIAIISGRLAMVKLIHQMCPQAPKGIDEVECAAHKGFLHIVQWLYEHRCPRERCSSRLMDEIAGKGHLDVVRWLIEAQGQKCTVIAIDLAARAGHLEVIRYLHENRHVGCTERTMEFAVTGNHMRIVKWLVAHRPAQFYTKPALEAALENARGRFRGRIEVWLNQTLAQLQDSGNAATTATSSRPTA